MNGHDLYKLRYTCVPSAAYHAKKSFGLWFWRIRFLKGFTLYGHGGHLGHVTICTNFGSFDPVKLRMKYQKSKRPSGFREDV